jgi:hypothetical protein
MKRLCLLAMVLVVMLGGTATWADADFYVIAGGGVVGTKITSLPASGLIINNPGFYFLGGNLNYSGTASAIFIKTDNVTIDLMGFQLAGNGSSTSVGINLYGVSNVEIRNGTVTNFGHGVFAPMSGDNNRIINIRAVHNTGDGIKLVGNHHLVRNCNTSNNTGAGINHFGSASIVTGNESSNNSGDGIIFTSGGNLLGNVVYGNQGYGFYLSILSTEYLLIDRNTVDKNTAGKLNGIPPNAKFGVNAGVP